MAVDIDHTASHAQFLKMSIDCLCLHSV
jgi:hypothetical protein